LRDLGVELVAPQVEARVRTRTTLTFWQPGHIALLSGIAPGIEIVSENATGKLEKIKDEAHALMSSVAELKAKKELLLERTPSASKVAASTAARCKEPTCLAESVSWREGAATAIGLKS
jgi:hypothetical protein